MLENSSVTEQLVAPQEGLGSMGWGETESTWYAGHYWACCTSPGWHMGMEQSVEWELAGETEALGENLPQCHFIHHKSHIAWPGNEPGLQRWEAETMARPLQSTNRTTNWTNCMVQGRTSRWVLHSGFVSRASQVRICIRRPTIKTEIFVGFLSPGKYWSIYLKRGNDRFLPNPFHFGLHNHPTIQSYLTYAAEWT
jgi:hypothetical protein